MRSKDKITVTLTIGQAKALRRLANEAIRAKDRGENDLKPNEVAMARRGMELLIRAEGYEPAIWAGLVGYRVAPSVNGFTFSEE